MKIETKFDIDKRIHCIWYNDANKCWEYDGTTYMLLNERRRENDWVFNWSKSNGRRVFNGTCDYMDHR